jgi:hypothetical protein
VNGPQQDKFLSKFLFYLGAAISLIVSFIVFFKTMAPTLSFWDCGEFIASSYIMGVPHPPGTPLFILIGKFFMLLGIMSTPALNTNFISVLSSALTAMITYIIIVKSVELIIKTGQQSRLDNIISKIGIYIGALTGSLLLAFSSTFWFNAVETEVYGLSMLLMVIITYMAMKWSENKLTGGNDILLVGIVYLLFLSISIHLTVFLISPAIIVYVALIDRKKLVDWRHWVSWGVLFSFAVPVYFLIFYIFPYLGDHQVALWFLLMIFFAVFFGYKTFTSKGKVQQGWGLYFAIMVVAIIGFTPHIYIPIRAGERPAINENNPDNLQGFENYLARRQYGQESMIVRMFKRRGALKHQFGDYPHMGFWGYFKEQYSNEKWGLLRYLPFLFGLFGMFISLRKSFKNGFLLAAIFLISSLGLILYLNFADGTRGDHLEVRDRDYFFTPAFVYYAILIGLGFAFFLGRFPSWLKNKIPAWTAYLSWAVVALLVLLLPLDTFKFHCKTHDRTGDFAPPDYAYNILNSCEKDAIIFTNGDNDTFPLWYLQEVENVRKDVRVVNLSLLNTDWYICQLKEQMGVPIDLDDDQIIGEPFTRQGTIMLYRPKKSFYDPIRKINRYLVPFPDPKTGNPVRVQDQMIEHIVLTNKWKYPIYLSTSVPNSNRWTLSDYTIRQAMALQVMPKKPEEPFDPEKTEDLLYDVYRYRGINDIEVFKDENNVGLTTTYPERFLELANYYLSQKDTLKTRKTLYDTIERFPFYYQPYIELARLYPDTTFGDSAKIIYQLGVENLNGAIQRWPHITLYWQFLGVLHYTQKNFEEAIRCYEKAIELDPSSSINFNLLIRLYSATGQKEKGMSLLKKWMKEHPEDMEARNLYNIYRRMNR